MSYKTILVYGGTDPASISAIRAAKALGERFGAALIGVGAAEWRGYLTFAGPGFALASGEMLQAMEAAAETELAEAKAGFHDLCAGHLHEVAWRSRMDDPARSMIELARGADLIVAARPQGIDPQHFPSPTALVMESGLPVVIADPRDPAAVARTIVIGWKDTRETRRAVSDAMPLLKLAERVYVAHVCEAAAVGDARSALDDVIARLTRQGVKAEGVPIVQAHGSVTDALIGIAGHQSADMLVLGAYGHSRLREWAFGGVTRDLMEHAPHAILFSR